MGAGLNRFCKGIDVADSSSADRVISFGTFRLFPRQRLLLDAEKSLRIGSRALDILIALIERPGELLSRDELMARVWPNTVVEEGNLKVHVAGLRRVLGDGRGGIRYLINVPGRGYRFVAPVAFADEAEPPALNPETTSRQHNLPVKLTRLIGRDDVINNLARQLPTHRLLTIVGSGGIGKTAVALDVAEEATPCYEHGVWLIDFARIADPRLVPTALASALSLEVRSVDLLPSLIASLRDKQMLLVLDNCEHVIDAVAAVAAPVLKGARGVQILATSREPLRMEGEQVYRLPPLESPPASVRLSAAEALGFPAVQLFVERAAATMNDFVFADADAPSVGDICRKLDGIPLAIELAAARVVTFGVCGLSARLDDRLRLLTHGRRTALPRHQTISTATDWSFQLLSQEEQTVFPRLAIFAGGFTMEAARAVAGGSSSNSSDVADIVASLFLKSLVTADMGHREVRFRLLETTRAYALTKLAESGEVDPIARRHAGYYWGLLEGATSSPAGEISVASYAVEIDNIRAALNWTVAAKGDRSIAVALAAASAPIWFEMSLLTECHHWMGRALNILDSADRGTRREMMLQCALGLSLMLTQGLSSRARDALIRASELAESLRDLDYQLRALAGLSICHRLKEDLQGALAFARRSQVIAKDIDDPVALSTADYMFGVALFFLGDHAEALTYALRAHRRSTPVVRRAHIVRWGLDHDISARCVVAHVLWVQGLIDQSAQATRDILADAAAGGHPLSLCLALTWCGGILSLRVGDLQTAERSIALLKDHSERHALKSYHSCGLGLEGQLAAKRGDIGAGERLLRASLDGLRQAQSEILYTPFLTGFAEVLATAGRIDESLGVIDEALERSERNSVLWWMPEALRVKGEVLLLFGKADTATAEDYLRRSLDLARRQEAVSWELRAATSLARLWHQQDRAADARELLLPLYRRFNEGFETADLQCARRLLEGHLADVAVTLRRSV
jgi:predicted ATPase/DNA-binding winged helix-turn-helix (wHTH) protein